MKTTSRGRAPSASATRSRASSKTLRASWPKRWMLLGLPKTSSTARMASRTSGSRGVVAA